MAQITKTGESGFTIDGATLGGPLTDDADDCIVLNNCSDFTIRNVVIGDCYGVGIRMEGCTGTNLIDAVKFPGLMNGNIFGLDCDMRMTIRDCEGHTVARAGHKDGARGQFCQIVFSHLPGLLIEWNNSTQGAGSDKEDTISLNGSSGDPGDPMVVRYNWMRGRGPSTTGAGLAIGENGGSYCEVYENTVIDAGVTGMFVAGGTGNDEHDNRLYASAASSGQATNQAAHYIDDFDGVGGCTLNTIVRNVIDWYGNVDPYYDSGLCTSTTHSMVTDVDLSFLLTATPTAPRGSTGGGPIPPTVFPPSGSLGAGDPSGGSGGARAEDGSVHLRWSRRARMTEGWAAAEVPLDESSASFVVEIWDASRTTLMRTESGSFPAVSASWGHEFIYTADMQLADFGALQGVVTVSVYQVSAIMGRGYEAQAVI